MTIDDWHVNLRPRVGQQKEVKPHHNAMFLAHIQSGSFFTLNRRCFIDGIAFIIHLFIQRDTVPSNNSTTSSLDLCVTTSDVKLLLLLAIWPKFVSYAEVNFFFSLTFLSPPLLILGDTLYCSSDMAK